MLHYLLERVSHSPLQVRLHVYVYKSNSGVSGFRRCHQLRQLVPQIRLQLTSRISSSTLAGQHACIWFAPGLRTRTRRCWELFQIGCGCLG